MYRRAFVLLLGSGIAQLGPLLFAPVLARLYGAEVFGTFQLATAIAANVAVVACARYEFALPLAREDGEAAQLRRLCGWVLVGVVGLTALGALLAAWWWQVLWPLVVPLNVGALGCLSLWMLEATRRNAAPAMASARVGQYWGCGAVQAAWGGLPGAVSGSLWGLLWGPVVAGAAAAWALRRHLRVHPAVPATGSLRETARRFREFPLLNTPHAFLGALQDTLALALVAAMLGPAAAGIWGMTLRLLKAPATLAGGALSQALYPHLTAHGGATLQGRAELRRVLLLLLLGGLLLAIATFFLGPRLLPWLLGAGWEASGELAVGLAVYIGFHFVASPLAVVTMAWEAQRWALKVSLVGQSLFIGALAIGLHRGSLAEAAGWVSAAMGLFYLGYFWRLAYWPVSDPHAHETIA